MVSFKVEADAKARVEGDESLERYPIVAKVKGPGKDGSIGVSISGDGAPVGARVAMETPVAIRLDGPATVRMDAPISIDMPLLQGLSDSLARLASGIKVELADRPVKVAIGEIPIDLTVSVFSPASEQVFRVEIKGSIGR
ncbi:MAG: hypothetical protein A4E45_01222 [Methanosaeta sp. PtaB.Bin039]|nr:MAG: hypothetical protein A4E45_01222 [Methanosaeta sp. PtaB.Bin039]OPY46761.1 MAG: hypothetical protein A4E47_00478 [Methanosaeta sp. PtaU1.Bin028]HOT07113.1 hypothetical protein [Methanotrichaceae archaeon]HQF17057.1 hypothetical protein [Methanotrichaceae archaeon]HQI91678.1 hypothetical protein [Methanotrichaceae archaeon]